MSIATFQQDNMRERLATFLRDGIFSGRQKPGERIVESQLAKELQVGQPTIREALQVLEHEGLVSRISKRGCRVTELSLDDIAKIYEVRIELESLAASKIPVERIPAVCKQLETHLAEMRAAEAENNFSRFKMADLRFHRTIWEASGNRYLAKALDAVTIPLFAFGQIFFHRFMKTIPTNDAEMHQQLVDIIRSAGSARSRENAVRRVMIEFRDRALPQYDIRHYTTADVARKEAGRGRLNRKRSSQRKRQQ